MLRLFLLYGSASEFYPSAFFNGNFRLATYTGGPTYVPDHLGVLRSPGANLPAVQGMRLGWVEGPELVANPSFDVGSVDWTLSGGASIAEGRLTLMLTTTELQYAHQSYDLQAYKTYTIVVDVEAISAGGLFTLESGVGANWYSAINNLALGVNSYTVFVPILFANIGIKRALGTSSGSSIIISSFSIKEVIPTYVNTDDSGNAILPSTPQKTVTYNTDWTAKTFAETFDKFNPSDPSTYGWLCEPVRTNYALNSATPATHTTGTLAVGTYTLWQEGTGSIAATAGTAVGTFSTASNGTPATITITTAGTVVLTASGTNTWVQLELGAFKTSRIYTTTAPMVRAATVASFPTAGKIPVNNFAIRMIVVPRATGQGYPILLSSAMDASNWFYIEWAASTITLIKKRASVETRTTVSKVDTADVPIDLIVIQSTLGCIVSRRVYSGGDWGQWSNGSLNSTVEAVNNLVVGSTYSLGSNRINSGQFTGNISLFDCIPIPPGITDPMAWAKTHWGVA